MNFKSLVISMSLLVIVSGLYFKDFFIRNNCVVTAQKDVVTTQKDYENLSDAIADENIEAIQNLILAGQSVQQGDNEWLSPLHSAAYKGNVTIVKLLLDHGADVHAKTGEAGHTPLHIAAECGFSHDAIKQEKFLEVAKLLVHYGADVNEKSKPTNGDCYEVGDTPLMRAAAGGQIAMANYLISQGAQLNMLDEYGNSALHYAAEFATEKMITCLVTHGANATIKNSSGKTAYKVACKNDKMDIAALLSKLEQTA